MVEELHEHRFIEILIKYAMIIQKNGNPKNNWVAFLLFRRMLYAK